MSRIGVETMNHAQTLAKGRAHNVRSKGCTGKLTYVDKTAVGETETVSPIYRCSGCGSYLGVSGGTVIYDGPEPPWTDWRENRDEAFDAIDGLDPLEGP